MTDLQLRVLYAGLVGLAAISMILALWARRLPRRRLRRDGEQYAEVLTAGVLYELDYETHRYSGSSPPSPYPRHPYVPPIFDVGPGAVGRPPMYATDLQDALGQSSKQVFVILGAPGAGKTTLLRQMVLEAADRFLEQGSRPLPVLLYLREHVHTLLDLDDLADLAVRTRPGATVGPDRMRALLDGRCLVLLDGLDEIGSVDERSIVVGWLRRQIDRYPRASWVIASRSSRYTGTLPATRVLTVGEFDVEQRAEYIRRWYRSVAEYEPHYSQGTDYATRQAADLLAWIERTPALAGLTSPVMLNLIAGAHLRAGADPRGIVEVYEELLELLFRRRQEGKHTADPSGLSSEQQLRIARRLALFQLEDGRPRFDEGDVYDQAGRIVRGRAGVREFFTSMTENGLLVELGDGNYAFVHRPVQEYLAAQQLTEQKSVRMLAGRIEDPGWWQTIVFWAAKSDASLVIRACLDSATTQALELARNCLAVTPQVAPELREAVERFGMGEDDSWRAFGAGPLADYVERQYAVAAAELIEQAGQDERPIDVEDFSNFTASFTDDENGVDHGSLLSAAVLGDEAGLTRDAARFRARGLTALALAVRGESRESARDLCLAAVSALGDASRDDTLLGRAVSVYLDAPPGTDFRAALRRHDREGESVAMDLIVPLLACSETAGALLVEAVRNDNDLSARANADLRAASAGSWGGGVEIWRRDRRKLAYRLRSVAELELRGWTLREAADRVADQLDEAPASMELGALADALKALHMAMADRQFDYRDRCLRKAAHLAGVIREGIHAAPTSLTVEVVEPAAARIGVLADEARRRLVAENPPSPGIAAALPAARVCGPLVTAQVRVRNADGAAPLETAWLAVSADPDRCPPGRERIDLPAPVPGGASATVFVPFRLGEDAQDVTEIEFDVVLHHRPRYAEDDAQLAERLAVSVERGYTPVQPNPFSEGALGRPIADPAMFFGREELIGRIRQRLCTAGEPGAGIAIYGQKRTGKSSIALQLMRLLAREDGFAVINAGSLGGLTRSGTDADRQQLAALLWRILTGVNKTLVGGTPLLRSSLTRGGLAGSLDPVGDFVELLHACRADRPDLPPWVVFFDEFQYVDHWIRTGLVSRSFMQSIKAIIEARLFHLVLVGQPQLKRVIEADPNAFGVFGIERVTYLNEAGARALVREPVQGAPGTPVRHLPTAVEQIIDLTGGNPYYLQKFCYELVEYMNKENAATVTEADVAEVAGHLVETMNAGDFDNLESAVGVEDHADAGSEPDTAAIRQTLVSVARASSDGPTTLREIEYCHGGAVSPELLDDLVAREVLRRDTRRYRIAVGLYRSWLERYFTEGRA